MMKWYVFITWKYQLLFSGKHWQYHSEYSPNSNCAVHFVCKLNPSMINKYKTKLFLLPANVTTKRPAQRSPRVYCPMAETDLIAFSPSGSMASTGTHLDRRGCWHWVPPQTKLPHTHPRASGLIRQPKEHLPIEIASTSYHMSYIENALVFSVVETGKAMVLAMDKCLESEV